MSDNPQELFEKRTKRIQDAIELKQSDRIPFVPYATFFPARYAGISFEEAMHRAEKTLLVYTGLCDKKTGLLSLNDP